MLYTLIYSTEGKRLYLGYISRKNDFCICHFKIKKSPKNKIQGAD